MFTLRSRNEKDNKNQSKRSQSFSSQSSFKCVPMEPKMYFLPIAQFYMWHQTWPTIHKITATQKGTSSIIIGQKKLYEWTYNTYTKVLRCKTWKKLTYDVHLNNKNCQWCGQNKSHDLFRFYDLSTHFIRNLSIVDDYLIRNNIFDKAYDLSTYLIKIDWLNNSKSW